MSITKNTSMNCHFRMTEVYSINDFWIKNVKKMSPIGNIRQLSDILDKFVIKMKQIVKLLK